MKRTVESATLRPSEAKGCRLTMIAASALTLAGCGASLPSGGFVTGTVGEVGAHFADNTVVEPKRRSGAASDAEKAAAALAGPGQIAAEGQAQASSLPGSIADLAKAHSTEPRNPQHALAYGRALKREGKRREALAVLDTAADAEPKHQAVRVEQGLLSLELGQSAKAEAALKEAAGGPATDWRVYSGLGIAASSQGRQKEAQGHFAKALEMSPNNPTVLNNMAVSLLLDRNVEMAETLLRRASKNGTANQQVKKNLELARALKSDGGDGEVVQQ